MKLVLPVEILEFNIAGGTSSTSQVSSTPGADEVVCSFFTQQTTSPPLDNEDLQQIDQDDLEELDIRWLVAMMGETIRVCRDSFRKTGRKLWISKENNLFTFDKSKVKCYNCHRKGHLCRECKSGRNYREKIFMGYGTQLDEMSNKSKTDSEISMSVFEVRSSDEKITPANDSFFKADGYHAAPPPITRNLLTPRADISFAGLDEYAIRKKIIESKTDTTKSKTSETVGKTNEVNIEKPKSVHESVVSKPKINRDKVIIKDWKSDDEDDVSSVKTVSLVKTNETQTVRNRVDKIGQISQKERIGFKKIKACFVCKKANMVNGCSNSNEIIANRVNQQKFSNKLKYPQARTFVPSGVLTRTGLVNLVKPNGKRAVHTVSTAKPISSARPISTARLVSAARPFASKKCTNCYKEALWLLESDPKGGKITAFFKLLDESQVVLRAPRQNDVYSLDLKNIVPSRGKPPSISFMRPFGCPLTILNTLDPLGKFDGKSDEGYLLRYSTTSKAFRVYNKRTKRVEENIHIDFLEDQPNVAGSGPDSMFDLDFLTNTMNYIPVHHKKDKEPTQEYILLPLHPHRPRISVEDVVQAAQEKPSKTSPKDTTVQDSEDVAEKEEQHMLTEADQAFKMVITQEITAKAINDVTRQAFEEEKKRAAQATSINKLNTGRPSISASNSPLVSTANTPYASATSTSTGANTSGSSFIYLGGQIPIDASTLPNADLPIDPNMPDLEDDSNVFPNDGIFSEAYDDDDVGTEADLNNMDNTINVSPIPILRVHKDHPKGQILGDPKSAV
ncbi:putative ribonuclease H-like domain-containing protein, partial [Tanacetum coccineum]